MDRHTGKMCEEQDEKYDCPDDVITYSSALDEYGLIIHDGGTSSYEISFCPFCGTKLPESKRDRWFEELESLGFDSPSLFEGNIPLKYQSDDWYKNT